VTYASDVQGSRARAWFGLTAIAAFAGVVIQLFVTTSLKTGFFHTSTARTLNVFVFFTIQSNLIVGATCLLLTIDPTRSSLAFRAWRLTGVVAITITGLVYHTVLARLFDLESWALVADNLIHTVVPVLAVLGWLIFGPRGLTSRAVVRLSVLFPIAWLTFTLIRGAFVHFYPYPFVDVEALGYARVLINCVWVAVLYLGLATGADALDRRLGRGAAIAPA
jgi:hypothetical protein